MPLALPSEKNLKVLEDASKTFKKLLGFEPIISGGASNLIPLMLKQKVPSYISNVRIGEGIMNGVDAIYKERIPGCFTDCFKLGGEIIELKTKPTTIEGNFRGQAKNVFGEIVKYKEMGLRKRAILNIGKLDTDIKGLIPIDNTIEVIMEFGQKNNIPTYCFEREFDNFSNSRNYALEKLKEVVSELNWNPNDVYHYWIDCDEVMIVDKFKKSLSELSYQF